MYGNPARLQGWMCKCGIKLQFALNKGAESAECTACGERYIKNDRCVALASETEL